jgi:hypothetical protein
VKLTVDFKRQNPDRFLYSHLLFILKPSQKWLLQAAGASPVDCIEIDRGQKPARWSLRQAVEHLRKFLASSLRLQIEAGRAADRAGIPEGLCCCRIRYFH